ncbi:HAD-IIIC family phosphatase [Paraliomyxa miuraensis]|uniref:HAD-IIIC family phosphatase n=1 Tax=Paraliomyxa miuraensis TaxID=376150 RepID=UPI002256D048|nr:HAD-IIIC family phosphatase [Paraliomyxa miuraensis]MCX4247765.1 HAD-IIIC family phosphatase [Paraliomyxa miuraensis]
MKLHPLVSVHFCADKSLLTHCGSLESILAPDWVGRGLLGLADDPSAADEIDDEFLGTLRDRGFLCEEDRSEEEELRGYLRGFFASLDDGQARLREKFATRAQYWRNTDLGATTEDLDICMFGGCTFEIAMHSIAPSFARRGHRAGIHLTWPVPEQYRAMAGRYPDARVWIVQPFIRQHLERLFKAALDENVIFDDVVAVFLDTLRTQLSEIATASRGRLCLLHNYSPPHLPVAGRFDTTWPAVFRTINRTVTEIADAHDHVFVVDEERISATIGREGVHDSSHRVFGHHAYAAGLLGGHRLHPWGDDARTQLFFDALAEEYVVAYEAWIRRPRIKLVIVDLDNTLWPGNAGDEGFELDHQGFQVGGPYQALQEALALLKQRGVLLAVASKNTEAAILPVWAAMDHQYVRREDFVITRINWRPKSENIQEILAALGCDPRHAIFIDDNPVEREEVAAAIPGLHVYDGDMEEARRYLLEHPALETLGVSQDASRRTAMVAAQLQRDQEVGRHSTHEDFLESLEIRLSVRQAESADLLRVGELIARTNQFNTTAERMLHAETEALIGSGAVWLLRARDRFADYGSVAILVLEQRHIRLFAMSCRVLPLEPAVPFASEVLRLSGSAVPGTTGRLVKSERNEPCYTFFEALGFEPTGDDTWTLRDASKLPQTNRSIYHIDS